MTTFRFNFNGPAENNQQIHVENTTWLKCEEVEVTDQIENFESRVKHAKMFMCGDVEIGHISVSQMQFNTENSYIENAIHEAEKEHSDLVTGKYEGGLKVWECTYDLIEYLESIEIDFENKSVLDLGCGSGILGIYSYQKGAQVTFQDYNKEVVEQVTIPNILLNIEDEENITSEVKRCKFYSGDWQSFNDVIPVDQKYDLILTSETIYNMNNYYKLIEIFENRLNSNGTIYVAAKTHYFGVGGGMREFEQALAKTGSFQYEIIWKTTSGIQREIMKINRII